MATVLRRRPFPIIPARPIRHDAFNLLATTTAPGQTVELEQIAAYAPTAVVWGDGVVTQVPANTDMTLTHVYAAAGGVPG